jgi:hypothetical protein
LLLLLQKNPRGAVEIASGGNEVAGEDAAGGPPHGSVPSAASPQPRWWHPDEVGLVISLAELLVILLPLVAVVIGGIKAISVVRRLQDDRAGDTVADAETRAGTATNQAAQWGAITRMVEEHTQTDARWLDYELDVAKLLDFPLMTDMRDPLTMRFHQAKVRADLLRPTKAEDLLDDRDAAREYLSAVENYVTTFKLAESEAIRRRRNDFSLEGQQRLSRAKSLLSVASDTAATPQERAHAYDLARKELDGLLVLPETTRAAIERGIAGEIDG